MNSAHFTLTSIYKRWASHVPIHLQSSSALISWNKAMWPLPPVTLPIYDCYQGALSSAWRGHGCWWCTWEDMSGMPEPWVSTTYVILHPSAGSVLSVQHVFIIRVSRMSCVFLRSIFVAMVNALVPCSERNMGLGSGSRGQLMWT